MTPIDDEKELIGDFAEIKDQDLDDEVNPDGDEDTEEDFEEDEEKDTL